MAAGRVDRMRPGGSGNEELFAESVFVVHDERHCVIPFERPANGRHQVRRAAENTRDVHDLRNRVRIGQGTVLVRAALE